MPATEIDDIFSGKISVKQLEKPDAASIVSSKKAKKKKDKKKGASDVNKVTSELSEKILKTRTAAEPETSLKPTSEADPATKKRKRDVPEVIDTTLPVKRHKSEHDKEKIKSRTVQKSDISKFKDSRGSSGSECGFGPAQLVKLTFSIYN
jgi:hypothetical protein